MEIMITSKKELKYQCWKNSNWLLKTSWVITNTHKNKQLVQPRRRQAHAMMEHKMSLKSQFLSSHLQPWKRERQKW